MTGGSKHVLLKRGELTPVPKLNFSKPMRLLTLAELAAIDADTARHCTREARLERIAYYREHPECLLSWDKPYTLDEYERMVLAGEFD